MKCPKCQYISFDSTERCRNCGYDFSLADEPPPFDLPISSGNEAYGPLADLPLESPAPRGREELPLFAVGSAREDAPLVSPRATPRPPLAVRRDAPAVPGGKPRSPAAAPEKEARRPATATRVDPAEPGRAAGSDANAAAVSEAGKPVSVVRRLLAALLDLVIVGLIDVIVMYLTLQLTRLQPADAATLPKIPLAAFLLLLNGGYFVLFTAAGGQTIGKMAAAIRVIPEEAADAGARVPFGAAVVRAAAYAVSLLPAGLGCAPILFSPDRRALHDRLSNTRVVKA